MAKDTQLIVFDIQNTQEDYLMCLNFIKICEDKTRTVHWREQKLLSLISGRNIMLQKWEYGTAYRRIEEPIEKRGQEGEEAYAVFRQNIENRDTLDETNINEILEGDKKLHYHLRVHMEFDNNKIRPGNLIHFQYLALLLKRLSYMGFFKRKLERELTAFLVPTLEEYYPFNGMDTDIYNVISQYLRMVAQRYTNVIWCANIRNGKTEVHTLEMHITRGSEAYFPIIFIDDEMYNVLFAVEKDMQYYRALKGKRKASVAADFGNAKNQNPVKAMPDFIVKTAYKRLITVLGKNTEEIFSMLEEKHGRYIMKFCLFAFLLSEGNELENIWELAGEIESGIRQVVQNAIQHSEIRGCVFSFYLHEKNVNETEESYIARLSEQYPSVMINTDNEKVPALEIFVSDLNENQDMLDNFKQNLCEDQSIYSEVARNDFSISQKLIDNMDKVFIRNFFSEFEEGDLRDIWGQFRRQDIVAHVGLSLFSVTAEKCSAAIKVVSSKDSFSSPDDHNCFYKAYGVKKPKKRSRFNTPIIAGTQFSILIPLKKWSKFQSVSLGQLDIHNGIAEDYESFARYLDYSEKDEKIRKQSGENILANIFSVMGNGILVGSRSTKNLAVNYWYKFWCLCFEENCKKRENEQVVYSYDFENIADLFCLEHIEVCLKGILLALGSMDGGTVPLYLALKNLPEGFIDTFCKIATLIGVREFPENVQLYLSEKRPGRNAGYREMILVGKNFTQLMYNAYILSIEHGNGGCSYQDYVKTVRLHKKLDHELVKSEEAQDKKTDICPFDVLLSVSKDVRETLFERKICDLAEKELDGSATGYKLSQTHMRLGSKVHIESFYEMSFLFYRTSIANRIAFLILKDLLRNGEKLDLKKDAIIFYGYASYSKAILTSLTEILRFWRASEYKRKVGFASYQHNLQSDSSEIQMYFGLEAGSFGKVDSKNILKLEEYTQIIQIVPISSTLTTFGKMWNEFLCHLYKGSQGYLCQIYKNYTVFWVVDREKKEFGMIPSDIEEKYWVNVKDKMIETKLKALKEGGCVSIRYFMHTSAVWHDPLFCSLCYPENVIEEVPLVETDPTSTVPAQQIRYKTKEHIIDTNSEEFRKQIIRLKKLRGCIFHGHIVRRQNHYQYYIDTQKYFYETKDLVMEWLRKLREKNKKANALGPILHIIFSPEHNTNVGFAQYVNTYYFKGRAEVVSINVDKEYRSNFVCEHAALMKMISQLHEEEYKSGTVPLKFYFVDDTIITGETFEKANSFLHSLIPKKVSGWYHANLFEKIFLLMDRLSMDTKRMYVEDMENNFHSFVHIDVSNSRTHGDSCVGCKLERDTEKMFKRSATRKQAEYWAGKLYDYRKVGFDNLEELEKIDRVHSYERMMVYHVLQNVIIKNGQSYCLGDAYDVLLNLMEWLLSGGASGKIYGYKELLEGMEGITGVKNVLKIICRPFFTFDYKIRLQVLTLYVFLTEALMGTDKHLIISKEGLGKSRKQFLFEEGRVESTLKIAEKIRSTLITASDRLHFLTEYMFEGLTEMGSTYLMRKQSFIKVYSFLREILEMGVSDTEQEEFWRKYTFNIHRILSNTKDETKELWLEYLYSTGNELKKGGLDFDNKKSPDISEMPELYACITKGNEDRDNGHFKRFLLELFLQNTGVNFDGMEKKAALHASGEYFMETWNGMRKLKKWVLNQPSHAGESPSESELFQHFINNQESEEKNKREVRAWYEKLLNLIIGVGKEKYGFKEGDVNIVLMTEDSDYSEGDTGDRIQHMDIIREWIRCQEERKPAERYEAKMRLQNALQKKYGKESLLEKMGYTLFDHNEEDRYFILFFDNPEPKKKKFVGRSLRKLARVFLYVSVKNNSWSNSCGLRYIMRDILTYRNRLLRVLEQDFYGDTFINYARSDEEKNILSHEKAASHSASTDDEIAVELFVKPQFDVEKIYQYLGDDDRAYWLLIRNYTNNQIAKLFNRSFKEDEQGEIPPLYLRESIDTNITVFAQTLNVFGDLGINSEGEKQDNRFGRIQEIMDIKIELEEDTLFVRNPKGFAYNLEYFKCILVDILISSIKYQTTEIEDFLLRVEELGRKRTDAKCKTRIYRLDNKNEDIDYLVIENPITTRAKLAYGLVNWEKNNEKIKMRMEDPLDFIDGHMSLLTIKRYIENLEATKQKCHFEYSVLGNGEDAQLIFSTYLPVLRRRENGKGNLLD